MHVATAVALLIYLWREWVRIIAGFFASFRQLTRPAPGTRPWQLQSPDQKLAWLIVLATIPVGLVGLEYEHEFRVITGHAITAAYFLIANGVILYLAESFRRPASLQADGIRQNLPPGPSASPGWPPAVSPRQLARAQTARCRRGGTLPGSRHCGWNRPHMRLGPMGGWLALARPGPCWVRSGRVQRRYSGGSVSGSAVGMNQQGDQNAHAAARDERCDRDDDAISADAAGFSGQLGAEKAPHGFGLVLVQRRQRFGLLGFILKPGWRSSYTDENYPADVMAEWVTGTVREILALGPRSVLEVGCGAGLLIGQLLPHVERYVATDVSAEAVRVVASRYQEDPVIEVSQCMADDMAGLGVFDVVVLNSVVQYFPDQAYLDRVLTAAATCGGDVFIGDVRDMRLLGEFHLSVDQVRRGRATSADELRARAWRTPSKTSVSLPWTLATSSSSHSVMAWSLTSG